MPFGDHVRLLAYVTIIRPLGPLIMGLAAIFGLLVALGSVPHLYLLLTVFFTSFFLAAAAFVINDYVDLEIDRINAPNRPLPSGLMAKKSALVYGFVLSATGLTLPAFLPFSAFAAACFTFLLSLGYTFYAKQTGLPGNAIVAFSVSAPFLFGAVAAGEVNLVITMVFLLSFLSNLGREITKGIADAKGDSAGGVRSVALVNGPKAAALLVAVFFVLTAIAGPILAFCIFVDFNVLLTVPIVIVEMGFVFSALYLLRNPDSKTASQVNTQANLWMILVMAVFLSEFVLQHASRR